MPPGRSGQLGYIIGDYQVQVIFDNKSDFLYHIIFANRAEGVALSPNHMMEQHLLISYLILSEACSILCSMSKKFQWMQ